MPARDLDTYTAARDYAAFDLVYVEDIGAGQFGEKGAGAVIKSRLAELLLGRNSLSRGVLPAERAWKGIKRLPCTRGLRL